MLTVCADSVTFCCDWVGASQPCLAQAGCSPSGLCAVCFTSLQVTTGGKKAGGELEAGYFFEPTVLTECTIDMKARSLRVRHRVGQP